MREELPSGWIKAKLNDIASLNPRHPKELSDNLSVSFVPMPAINEAVPFIEQLEEKPLKTVRKGYTHFADGDVLFAKITPCMENGKGAVADGLHNGIGCGTTELHVIRPLEGINPYFIYWFLAQPSIRRNAKDNFTGSAGQARVPINFMRELELPLPPLAEQGRIVAKLEQLLGKVQACQKRLDRIPLLLKRFRQSVLAAACSGRLTEDWRTNANEQQLQTNQPATAAAVTEVEELFDTPSYWHWLPLQALCDPDRSICYGVIKLGKSHAGGVPCLRTSDVKPLHIETKAVKCISPSISDQYRRTLLRGGEVLVSVRGTLGGVSAVPHELKGYNISREVAVVPVMGAIPKFIAFWIASISCQNWLTQVAKGVAYTGINIADLQKLSVAIPSQDEQDEIVRRVEALFALANKVYVSYRSAYSQIEKLSHSILAKAFRGELVPQDPNDEPALVLLEKIKASKLAAKPKRRKKQHK